MAHKKLPKISLQIVKDENEKVASVILKYDMYVAILDEMDHLKKNMGLA